MGWTARIALKTVGHLSLNKRMRHGVDAQMKELTFEPACVRLEGRGPAVLGWRLGTVRLLSDG